MNRRYLGTEYRVFKKKIIEKISVQTSQQVYVSKLTF